MADRTRSRRSRILRTGIALARRVVAIAIDPSLFLEWEEMSAKLVTAREAERALQVRLDQKGKRVRELEGLVGIDPLTGVANRLGSEAAFERLVRITQRGSHPEGREGHPLPFVGVLYLDMDSFRELNSRYGHEAADQFLVALARELVECLRPDDAIIRWDPTELEDDGTDLRDTAESEVVRWGGDEFILLVPDANRAGLETVATRIYKQVTQICVEVGGDVIAHRTASIGGHCVRTDRGPVIFEDLRKQANHNLLREAKLLKGSDRPHVWCTEGDSQEA